MTGVYITENGTELEEDDIERKEKCDFCGALGEMPGVDGVLDGELPRISGEGYAGDMGHICRDCLQEPQTQEDVDNVLKSEEEIREELAEDEEEEENS